MIARAQMALKFPHTPDYSAENLFVHSGLEAALRAITAFGATEPGTLVLYGPEGSGKTHLLNIWAARHGAAPQRVNSLALPTSGARFCAVDEIENMTPAAQETLFHWANHMRHEGGWLLIACRQPPAQLNVLPDLRSRLLAGEVVEIGLPTEAELRPLLAKWAWERQLSLPEEVVTYLIRRAERSPATLENIVAALDTASLEGKRAITVPLAKEVLESFPA